MTEQEQKKLCDFILERSNREGWFCSHGGIRYDSVSPTLATAHFVVNEDLVNPLGICHGGVYYTVMDQLAGMAAGSTGRAGVTLNCNISYLKSARIGDTVYCKAEAFKLGRTVAVYHAECYGEDGEMQCTGIFHFFFKGELADLAK